MVREFADLYLRFLFWVGKLAVWEIILQVLMQLHDWRLQLHFERIMDSQWAIFKGLKCRASTLPLWLGMWTVTAKHSVWLAPLVSACCTFFLISNCCSSMMPFYISEVLGSSRSRRCCTIFFQYQILKPTKQYLVWLALVMMHPEAMKCFEGMVLAEEERPLPS